MKKRFVLDDRVIRAAAAAVNLLLRYSRRLTKIAISLRPFFVCVTINLQFHEAGRVTSSHLVVKVQVHFQTSRMNARKLVNSLNFIRNQLCQFSRWKVG